MNLVLGLKSNLILMLKLKLKLKLILNPKYHVG